MTNDMTLTFNTLPAKDTGKEARRAAESQSVSPQQGTTPVSGKPPVAEAARSGRSASASAPVPKEELEGAVSQMKDFAQMLNRELQFDMDEDLGRTVVRVIDKESGDLIRQIPSEEVLELAKQMQEMHEAELEGIEGSGAREQPLGLLMKTQA